MALEWLSRHLLKTAYEKHKDDPEGAHCSSCTDAPGLQDCSSAVDMEAALKRMTLLKELYLTNLIALRDERRHASETQAATLQKSIDQHWAVYCELCEHESALLLAPLLGKDIDFDIKFWREHSKLLLQLPESMQPDPMAASLKVRKKSTSGVRKRELSQTASVEG